MKILRLGIWGIIVVLFALLASIPVVWATPEQSSLNQTLPPATAIVATAVVGTPTATPIPLLPPSGNNAQGNGFFILTGVFLVGGALVLLLSAQWKGKQIDH
ncbi:MAG: hypothetical protein JXR84_26355 [Anaerolineae bacterium]|nr:hypothetical protein [Anaerolineae bacterium]